MLNRTLHATKKTRLAMTYTEALGEGTRLSLSNLVSATHDNT